MLFLQSNNITDLYCWVDDLLPQTSHPRGGRPSILSDSELVTILVWNVLVVHQKTLKDVYDWVKRYHRNEFPIIPSTYQGFVAHCHRTSPLCLYLLGRLLCTREPVRIMDSTMLPVCKIYRADTHTVARNVAAFGKNHQGWHYGFKLHASIGMNGTLCGISITPANIHDAQMMGRILNKHAKIAVGDTLYGARVMGRIIWERYGTVVVAPPHPSQKHKLTAPWQIQLLHQRPKIESVFDVLKEHLHLVTSFARSSKGYLLHYVRILLAYQILALCGVF